jgi:hypothetical protein
MRNSSHGWHRKKPKGGGGPTKARRRPIGPALPRRDRFVRPPFKRVLNHAYTTLRVGVWVTGGLEIKIGGVVVVGVVVVPLSPSPVIVIVTF